VPTIRGPFGPYRLFFYSFDCNEPRHVHVQRERRVCKFWLDRPALADNHGFHAVELRAIGRLVREHRNRIAEGWNEHCGSD
jgi:hypothetical protein